MFQTETIYDLVPREMIKPPKAPLYISKYPYDLYPTGSTFGLHTTSFPGISNLSGDPLKHAGGHPITSRYSTFGRPDGK
jgi:hypothetical protein